MGEVWEVGEVWGVGEVCIEVSMLMSSSADPFTIHCTLELSSGAAQVNADK